MKQEPATTFITGAYWLTAEQKIKIATLFNSGLQYSSLSGTSSSTKNSFLIEEKKLKTLDEEIDEIKKFIDNIPD